VHAGLGLAIVRQIAGSHGGSVALHNVPAVGSTVVVWLPSAARTGAQDALSPPTADPVPRPSH
jgi:signal transduction histidine kinase